MLTRFRMALTLAVAAAGILGAPVAAQQSRSAPLAVEFGRLCAERHIQYVAARDPEESGRFVAAMYAPGPSLLVLSARYTVPAALELVVDQKQYGKAYADLNGASIADSKLFIQDMGANGLLPRPVDQGAFDIVYERVVKQTMFDGEWEKQGLRQADYDAHYRAIDERYARMLSVLLAELKK